MNHLAFSHIAWPPTEEPQMLEHLKGHQVKHLELAPVRAFGNPLDADESSVRRRAEFYHQHGFHICAFQALLFGSEDLYLFRDAASREKMKQWLIAVGKVAGWCGASAMVFGSPKNRLKGALSKQQANEIACEFFREIGDKIASFGTKIVMEANPAEYGADYCTSLSEAAELVAMVDSPGFLLHVDAGGLAVTGEDFTPVIQRYSHLIGHFHASQINLGDWADPHPVHQEISQSLRSVNYDKIISIEMRSIEPYISTISTAIAQVKNIYF